MKKSSYRGVPGVWKVDSGKKGPVLGVTVHTHGNEPSGLGALSYFRNVYPIESRLKKGSVIFVLNNIKATEMYLRAKTDAERKLARYVDVNMNRLPNNLLKLKKDRRYEIQRALMLLPIWKEFGVGIDIHSMRQRSKPFIMSIGTFVPHLVRGFPMNVVVSNVQKVMKSKPAIAFYGKQGTKKLGVETGSHEDTTSFKRASLCAINIMKNLDMIGGGGKKYRGTRTYRHYRLVGSLWVPNKSFSLVRIFKNYERVKRGTLIATNGRIAKMAPLDGHIILPPRERSPLRLGEEILFFSAPVQHIRAK